MVTYKELISFIWQFITRQKWIFLFLFLLDTFAWALDTVLWPYILHLGVDIFARFEESRALAWSALQVPIWGGIALVVYVELASRTMGFLMAKAMPRLQADIRMTMFDHIQRHSPQYFNERFAGSLANKITDMTTQVESIIQQFFWPIVPAFSACMLGVIFLWFVNPLFAWILLGWILIHLSICFLFARSCDRYEHKHGEARSALLGKIVDSLTNNFAVNLFYRFGYEKKLITPFQQLEEKTNSRARQYVEAMRSVTSFFYFLGVILAMNGALIYLWIHQFISTGQVVQVFNTTWSLTIVLWTVGSAFPALFQAFGIAKQAYSVMRDPQEVGDAEKKKELRIRSGEIVFDRVFFRHGSEKLFEDKHVHIRGGEKVGLVGYTGAGKSTFVNLILRLYPLSQGKISIDGQDIAKVTLESLRRQIALIPQDPMLFHRSLRDNIRYGKPEATEEEIVQAAKLAYCDQFITSLPSQYDSVVGERGTKLSGGERQRIAIARAILVDAPILILDEATSALDSVTERYIQTSLETVMNHRTTIVIAHRLSTLARMDRILVFERGKIIEEGSHASLIKQNGHYAKMWNMQVAGFLPQDPL